VVVVTQRPTLLTSVDKVLVLKAGRAVAFGTPDQVLRREPPKPAAAEPETNPPKKAKKGEAAAARAKNGSTRERGGH